MSTRLMNTLEREAAALRMLTDLGYEAIIHQSGVIMSMDPSTPSTWFPSIEMACGYALRCSRFIPPRRHFETEE